MYRIRSRFPRSAPFYRICIIRWNWDSSVSHKAFHLVNSSKGKKKGSQSTDIKVGTLRACQGRFLVPFFCCCCAWWQNHSLSYLALTSASPRDKKRCAMAIWRMANIVPRQQGGEGGYRRGELLLTLGAARRKRQTPPGWKACCHDDWCKKAPDLQLRAICVPKCDGY